MVEDRRRGVGLGADAEKVYAGERVGQLCLVERAVGGLDLATGAFEQRDRIGVNVFQQQRAHRAKFTQSVQAVRTPP